MTEQNGSPYDFTVGCAYRTDEDIKAEHADLSDSDFTKPSVPARSPSVLQGWALQRARAAGISRPELFVNQMAHESEGTAEGSTEYLYWNQNAYNPGAGERGLAQITFQTFLALSTDEEIENRVDWRLNPWDALVRASRYMSCLLNKHNGRWDYALAEYNAGPGSIDPDQRPESTNDYIQAILVDEDRISLLTQEQMESGHTLLDLPGSEPEMWVAPREPAVHWRADYTVVEGDNLSAIADRYGTDVDSLLAHNDISNPDEIFVDQVLTVPVPVDDQFVQDENAEGPPYVYPVSVYTVQDGDTLGGIAAHFAVDLEALQEANDIDDPDEIQVGQILIIPTVPGRVGEAPTGDQEALASRVPGSAGGDEDGNGETEEPAEPGAEGAESQIDKPRSGDVGIFVTRWEGSDLPSFTDPNGNPVQRGREAIFAWGGIQRRPVIEKGDGSYLTAGYAKDALWTTRRIAEANELGLNTADFWEARPDDIQGKINQAKLAIGQGKVPEAAAIDYATPRPPSSPDETEQLDRRARPGGLSPELMAQARREAWYRARYELAGPTNWTHYWDAAQRARGFKGLPKWMLDLESNWRVPPPEVMNPQAVPPAQYPPQGSFQTAPGPAPQYPPPGRPQPVPMPNRPQPGAIDPGIYARPGPQPGTGGAVPMPAYQPQYAQAPTPDPRVVERMRLAELAASQAAMPGVLKERAQQAWEDQRRRARKAAASRMSTDQR